MTAIQRVGAADAPPSLVADAPEPAIATSVPAAPFMVRFARTIQADRAVAFGFLTRIWSVLAGPVSALLIASLFAPVLQGYYYTFLHLLALQMLAELGLGTVIVQFASHEWSRLSLASDGRVVGDAAALSRLRSIAAFAARWFGIAAASIAIVLLAIGLLFFGRQEATDVAWRGPWIFLCLATSGHILIVPLWSLLEGCNQVRRVYAFRLVQVVTGSLVLWGALLGGLGLWSLTASTAAGFTVSSILIVRRYREFFRTLLSRGPRPPDSHRVDWRTELWPLQWRIATSWLSGYFVFFFFTPVLFAYHGPVVAGQMGMTWALIALVPSLSSAWVAPRVPTFGMLIAQRRYAELDAHFKRTAIAVGIVALILAAGAWFGILLLNEVPTRFAGRLLSPGTAALFIGGQLLTALSLPFSSYLRAHKREPLLFLAIGGGMLVGASTLVLGRRFAALGAGAGFFAVNLIMVPLVFVVWQSCRRRWHA